MDHFDPYGMRPSLLEELEFLALPEDVGVIFLCPGDGPIFEGLAPVSGDQR